jgi:hypothetical protein
VLGFILAHYRNINTRPWCPLRSIPSPQFAKFIIIIMHQVQERYVGSAPFPICALTIPSSLKDTHTLSKKPCRSSTLQSIDELRQDWRETFEALGELAGQDYSGYADGFNDVLYETIAADKAFAAFTQGGELYCGASQQRLLLPKVLQDITCKYDNCGVRVRGIDAFKMHLQMIHELDDRGAAKRCKYPNCASRDMRGLLHVLRDHSGLKMRCRECERTFLITWPYRAAMNHWQSKHWDLYVEEDDRLVYFDEVCESRF